MDFDLLDRYLLEGKPEKKKVVAGLVRSRPPVPQAAAFLEGMRILGPRTPDLTLIALRLVLAGKPASDEAVVELKAVADRARGGGQDGQAALERYREIVHA